MGSYGRNYVQGNNEMYRAVTPYEVTYWDREKMGWVGTGEIRHRYAGPYATRGPAKAQCGKGGWVEVCYPTWEKLDG